MAVLEESGMKRIVVRAVLFAILLLPWTGAGAADDAEHLVEWLDVDLEMPGALRRPDRSRATLVMYLGYRDGRWRREFCAWAAREIW